MKRAVIVHCWQGYPEYCWYPSVKVALENKGFDVKVPAFPDTDEPQMKKWQLFLGQAIGTPDKDLYLIGHSIGCAAILRYLESMPVGKKIGGVVLVAGYTDVGGPKDYGYKELNNFFTAPFDFQKIKASAEHFTVIHSDNDPYVDLEYADEFKDKLGAEVIIKHNMGHFWGPPVNDPPCLELPDVVAAVEKMSR